MPAAFSRARPARLAGHSLPGVRTPALRTVRPRMRGTPRRGLPGVSGGDPPSLSRPVGGPGPDRANGPLFWAERLRLRAGPLGVECRPCHGAPDRRAGPDVVRGRRSRRHPGAAPEEAVLQLRPTGLDGDSSAGDTGAAVPVRRLPAAAFQVGPALPLSPMVCRGAVSRRMMAAPCVPTSFLPARIRGS